MNSQSNPEKNKISNEDFIEASIVMPCFNEERGVALCVEKAKIALELNKVKGEIIVCDNGSTDDSARLAVKAGAEVIVETKKGYGLAYQAGISMASGKYIIIGDADDSYDFSRIMDFIKPLRDGYEFINGSRIKGHIYKGAMPFFNRYLGNPAITFLLNLFFKSGFSDAYCGMKAFTRQAYNKIKPISPGMEFALELIINASRCGLKRTEIPVELRLRKGKSKLMVFKDAWRSFRFMLIYCPNYLFIIPGSLILVMGLLGMILLVNGPVRFFNHIFDFHAMIFANMLVLLGFQIISLGLFAKTYALAEGFEKNNTLFYNFYKIFNLEKGVFLGIILILLGLFGASYILKQWFAIGPVLQERNELFAFTLIIIGVQTVFTSFLISLVGMKNIR